jgi:hypothetical protein
MGSWPGLAGTGLAFVVTLIIVKLSDFWACGPLR